MATMWFQAEEDELARHEGRAQFDLATDLQLAHQAQIARLAKVRAQALAKMVSASTVAQVAGELGVTRQAVYRILKDAGLSPRTTWE